MPKRRLSDEERIANKKASALAYYYRHYEKSLKAGLKYRLNNKEKISAKGKKYDAANVEKIKERKRLYRIKTKERAHEYYKKRKALGLLNSETYYQDNAETIKNRVKKWCVDNPEKVRIYSSNKRAIKKKATGVLSKDIAKKLLILQKNKCACCKIELNKTKYHLDHITALINGGEHSDNNLQILCQSCNCSKSAKNPIDFMQSRGYLL